MNIAVNEARSIAKDAYMYGFPLVDNYRIQYAYFADAKIPNGSWVFLEAQPR